MEQRNFFKEMSDYLLKLQEVNERKKFEFVESVLSFMIGWITFYHQGHEIANDFYSAKVELQTRLQRTRNNFQMTQDETQGLRQKLLNNTEPLKKRFQDCESFNKSYAREGYLFLMEKSLFFLSFFLIIFGFLSKFCFDLFSQRHSQHHGRNIFVNMTKESRDLR